MSLRRVDIVGAGATLLTALGLAAVYGRLPERLATHWNLANEVDATMTKPVFVAVSLALVAGTYGFMRVVPRLDPDADVSEPLYETVVIVTVGFIVAVNAYVVAVNLGYPIPVDVAVPVALAGLYAALGTAMVRFDASTHGAWPTTPAGRAYVAAVLGRSFQLAAVLVLAALAFPAYTTPLVVGITVVAPPLALGYAAVTLEKSGRRTP
ncbi:DUF1648 domain-containing protein [Halosegnis longus]|uniref:DUF1648 domain-containing protein n=1 Tax=Halosegnis longus TaxID=2216012 RepID=UPI00096A6F45|nr:MULTISPECIES: DUF1648 domain-containing protein [Halobacteriales]